MDDENYSGDYPCLVDAACRMATQPLVDDNGGDPGLDEPTRTAARKFLRSEFERMLRDSSEPEGDDAGGD